ncbi:MAG: peptidoglycan DD-metalloendopeptidase family protein [Bacillota bacterium]
MNSKKWFSLRRKNADTENRWLKDSGIYKLFDKEGFYIILFLCVCIVAVTAVWVTKSHIDRLAVEDERNVGLVDRSIEEKPTANEESISTEDLPVVVIEKDKMPTLETAAETDQTANKSAEKVKPNAKPSQSNTAAVQETSQSMPKTKAVMKLPVMGQIGMDYAADTLTYSKTLEQYMTHYGIDIMAEENTPVLAVLAGEVVEVTVDSGLGVTIAIAHEGDIITKYANLSTAQMVKVGDWVEQGQVISGVGRSGIFEIADGPHLHFEVLIDGQNVDPKKYLPNK